MKTHRTMKTKPKPLTTDEFKELLFGGKIPQPMWTARERQTQTGLEEMSSDELLRYVAGFVSGNRTTEQPTRRKVTAPRMAEAKDWLTLAKGVHRLRLCPPSENGLPYFKRECEKGTVYLWNVVNRTDGKLYIWPTTQKFFEAIEFHARIGPICDAEQGNDFILTASEEGSRRRYSAPQCIPQSTPLDYEGELFNLVAAASK